MREFYSNNRRMRKTLDKSHQSSLILIAGRCQTSKSQHSLIRNAQKFQKNIYFSSDMPQDGTQGYNYQNIYRNFTRDIRQYFIEEFKEYKTTHNCDFKFRNLSLKEKFYPLKITQFSKSFIDEEIIQFFGNECNTHKLTFTLASYIQPKSVISSFSLNYQAIQKNCQKYNNLKKYIQTIN